MIQRIITLVIFTCYACIIFFIGIGLGRTEKIDHVVNNFLYRLDSALSDEMSKSLDDGITVWTEPQEMSHQGAVLLAGYYINNPAVILVDYQGKVIHRWNVEKKITLQEKLALHVPVQKTMEQMVFGIDNAQLLSDGSIIISQTLQDLANFRAQRLAKIDKESKLIWEVPGLFHHDFSIGSDGNVYAVGSELHDTIINIEPVDHKDTAFLTGVVKIVSPDGKLLKEIDVEEAFANSDYAPFLSVFDIDIPPQEFTLRDGRTVIDPIHLNSVEYLDAAMAANLPFSEEGDILLSLRGNSTIAILRPSEKRIVWAMRGPWRHQHYVRMSKEGTIFIYDNDGGAAIASYNNKPAGFKQQPRILEFNPVTQLTKIIYQDPAYKNGRMESFWRGYYKMLSDNTMIMSSAAMGRVIQVDLQSNKKIWELRTTPEDSKNKNITYTKQLPSVRHYDKGILTFLHNK